MSDIQFDFSVGEVRLAYKPCLPTVTLRDTADTKLFVRSVFDPDTLQLEESAKALFLNNQFQLLGIVSLGTGSLLNTVVSSRKLFQAGLLLNAYAFVLVHNHPSGDPSPSKIDDNLTSNISTLAKLHEMKFLDHIIITVGNYYSYMESGKI